MRPCVVKCLEPTQIAVVDLDDITCVLLEDAQGLVHLRSGQDLHVSREDAVSLCEKLASGNSLPGLNGDVFFADLRDAG